MRVAGVHVPLVLNGMPRINVNTHSIKQHFERLTEFCDVCLHYSLDVWAACLRFNTCAHMHTHTYTYLERCNAACADSKPHVALEI